MATFRIEMRNKRLVNTDPQRRCYNGCHFSYEMVWGEWEILHSAVPAEKVEEKLAFWRDLNDYAVSQRGENSRSEFRAVME